MLWKRKKHRCVVVYPDETYYYEVPIDQQEFRDERNNLYVIDPKKTVHVYVGGYANEIEAIRFHEKAKKLEFEPSKYVELLTESRIRKALFRMDEIPAWQIYAVIGGLILIGGLVLMLYMKVIGIADALTKVGLIR